MFENRYGNVNQQQRYMYGIQPNPNIVYGLNRVPDESYARSIYIPEGVSMAMFNETQDIVYIAANGGRYFRSFRLIPLEDNNSIAPPNRAEIQQMIREELVRNGYISGYSTTPNSAAPEYRGTAAEHDAGVQQFHAGYAGPQPAAGTGFDAQQRQASAGSTAAGSADGAAV